ncbi:DUF4231 domain-containing protein [Nocardia farcinica]|uniref:DUF4231 domain-containing protein n=1 Tax=Nocardia farcinica TaxID=37329 RepID=UPI0024588CE0|nr:DUF4231 domain-containing protein [Nocardia farcinica]
MPQLFQAADAASLDGQRSYVGGVRRRLLYLVVAAMSGIVAWRLGRGHIDVLGLVGTIAFVAAILEESSLWRRRPDKAWYDGRAVAESAKTLAWKYATGGLPFPVSMTTDEATRGLIEKLDELDDQFSDLQLEPIAAPQISDWMKEMRSKPLEDRRKIYVEARIRDQQRWYAAKAKYNRRRSKQWRAALFILEFAGAAASLITAVVQTSLMPGPALAMIAGAAIAWVETKQHDALARAYSAACRDLSNAEEKLKIVASEDAWAREVDDAEEAISREHVVWLATRHRL